MALARSIHQMDLPRGNARFATSITARRKPAAVNNLIAVRVNGGTSSTPTFINAKDDPQMADSKSSNP